jgi:UDP-N-acetylmuramyl pentapeptide phosphotransferase/UDP-N-acetylglucosamine-1-phosphate transferase
LQYDSIIIGFLTSLAISALAIPSIVTVARTKGLYDKPQGRKPGRRDVPTLGGLAIFAGIIISLTIFSDVSVFPELTYIIAGSVILFFIGIKDDILIIAPWWKLSGQFLAAMIITIMAGLQITQVDIIPWIDGIPNAIGIPLTILVIIIIINSFNLIDGIDGLASGIGIFTSIVLGLVFYQAGLVQYVLLSAVLCGSLMGFFYYNVFSQKKKILMGDTGSMMIGFISSILVLRFLSLENPSLPGIQIRAPQSMALAILIVPLSDMIRVILIRIRQGRSPFSPDRRHIHYRLTDMGFNHMQALGILLTINIFMVLLTIVLQNLGEFLLLVLIISIIALFYLVVWYFQHRRD